MEADKYIILTDQQLVTLVVDGDSGAFEALFNRYRDSIYKIYLQRTGGNVSDTEDLVQETFVKVFLNIERYNTSYTFGQWVYTIARNTFIDFVRRRRDDLSYDKTHSGGVSTMAVVANEATPEERVINGQQKIQLDNFLESMTPHYRKLIDLRFFKEYSYDEIAAELKLPLGTVKTQIHRARERLCRFITDNDMINN